jgi:hypothetical protein
MTPEEPKADAPGFGRTTDTGAPLPDPGRGPELPSGGAMPGPPLPPGDPEPAGLSPVVGPAFHAPPGAEGPAKPRATYRWYHKTLSIVFATLCLEMGCFLLLFPWTQWAADFADFKPAWAIYWDRTYIRLAISALGLVNLYIALIEIYRLRRFQRP